MKDIFLSRFIFLVLVSGLLASCDSDEPEPFPAQISRTVLVYMAADNNLGGSGYDRSDIHEMCQAADDGMVGNGRLLVYHSPRGKDPVLMEIRRGDIDTLVRYERGIPAATRSRMTDVFRSVRELAPADSYGLVLWGHGTGWIQDGLSDPNPTGMEYSFGPENGASMNVSTLADILEKNRMFDYVYFDCCYMASVETVYEMRNSADYIVGSATELITTGMPYQLNVSLLVGGTKDDLIRAAANTFEYYNGMSGMNRTCSMSVISTAGLETLAEAAGKLYAACDGSLPDGYTPQRFMDYNVPCCYYFDFLDYACAVAEASDAPQNLVEDVRNAFSSVVIYSAATPKLWNSVDLNRHNGLSTFIASDPDDFRMFGYTSLEWYSDVASLLFR